jgi:hypothetical protein
MTEQAADAAGRSVNRRVQIQVGLLHSYSPKPLDFR